MSSPAVPGPRSPHDPLTYEQTAELLMPVHPARVVRAKDGTRRLKHQDVRRRLTQIFGFTGWGEEIISNECTEERTDEKTGLIILTHRAHVRVHIRDGRGGSLSFWDGIGIWDGTQNRLRPGFTETVTQARHNVANGASTVGFLRAVMSLGDQFGLSLHLDEPPVHGFIMGTLTHPFVPPARSETPARQEEEAGDEHYDATDDEPADISEQVTEPQDD